MSAELEFGLRWAHILAGIIWIGLLYWFNLVNVPFQKVLDGSLKGQVNPPLFTRALAWFRWSAVVTVLVGLVLIYFKYWQDGDLFGSNTERTILTGGLLGIVMLFNVWVFIWPSQRKVLAALGAGQPPDPAWGQTALYASRTNFALSFPMLLFMIGATHYPMDWPLITVTGVILAAVGLGMVLTVQKYWASRF